MNWETVVWYIVLIIGLALALQYYQSANNIISGGTAGGLNVISALQGFPV